MYTACILTDRLTNVPDDVFNVFTLFQFKLQLGKLGHSFPAFLAYLRIRNKLTDFLNSGIFPLIQNVNYLVVSICISIMSNYFNVAQ